MLAMFDGPPDFIANRCAALVALTRENPYTVEPLRTCERESFASVGTRLAPGQVLPPLIPPYASVLLAPFALIPLVAAIVVWQLGQVLLCTIVAISLADRTGVPVVIAAGTVIVAATASVYIGQTDAVVLGAMVATATALRRNRDPAIMVAYGLLKPHFGLPVAASLIFSLKNLRLKLCLLLLLLAAGSIVIVGAHACYQYVTQTVPVHSASEFAIAKAQFSIAAALKLFAVPANLSIALNALLYVVAFAAGLSLAKLLHTRTGDSDWLVYVPASVTMFFSPYLHPYDLVIGLPLTFVLWKYARSIGSRFLRVSAAAALLLLTVIPPAAEATGGASVTAAGAPRVAAELRALRGTDNAAEASRIINSGVPPPSGATLATLIALKLALGLAALLVACSLWSLARESGPGNQYVRQAT